MHSMLRVSVALVLIFCTLQVAAQQLVFGSFRSEENAVNWAGKLATTFGTEMTTTRINRQGVVFHRVQTKPLSDQELQRLTRQAQSAGIEYWRLDERGQASAGVLQPPSNNPRLTPPARIVRAEPAEKVSKSRPAEPISVATTDGIGRDQVDFQVGMESRWFGNDGLLDGDQFTGSINFQAEYYRAWANDRKSLTVTPYLRWDSADSRRSHADLREFFYSYVGSDWDLHVGAKRVFWGVTEFHHLVDIINQTDLVENIDGEDKLGQPMIQYSTIRDWGVLDVYALTGFRERTFASTEGRLTLPFHIDNDAVYESGAEEYRVDGAIRWSHHIGPVEFGIHHFSGTSREPMLLPYARGAEIGLIPYYPVIDQTGVDAQAILGDWALKFEGLSRSGFGERYSAFNIGFERTLVGIFDSNADLGLVGEYMFDDRGEAASNTLFENDIALGGRLALNDFADTQALLGFIYDADHGNYVVSLEASRQLSETWHLNVEGRIFAGGKAVRRNLAYLVLTEPEYKSSWLREEDYLQIEFVKYF